MTRKANPMLAIPCALMLSFLCGCADEGESGATLLGAWQMVTSVENGVEKSFADIQMDLGDDEVCELLVEQATLFIEFTSDSINFYYQLEGVSYLNGYDGEGTNGEGVDNPEYFERLWATEDLTYEEDTDSQTFVADGIISGSYSGTESSMTVEIDELSATWILERIDDSALEDATDESEGDFHISTDPENTCSE